MFVNDRLRTLHDLPWNSTANDVVDALGQVSSNGRPRRVLLECWDGCCRPLGNKEFVLRNLKRWGGAEEYSSKVQLLLFNAARYYKARGGGRKKRTVDVDATQKWRSTCAQTHGKIALRKRRSGKKRKLLKAAAGREICRQLQYLHFQLRKVETLTKQPSIQSLVADDDVLVSGSQCTGNKVCECQITIQEILHVQFVFISQV